ncbi:MAG: DUF120 domain-containing protein [Planctomycetota bacterium]
MGAGEMLKTQGRVESGLGDAAHWIALLADHYRRLTGETLFPGTLNVRLDEEWWAPKGARCLHGSEYGGKVSIYVIPCLFMGEPAWILRTKANDRGDGDHPQTVVEIAARTRLRNSCGLSDGDIVELELPITL